MSNQTKIVLDLSKAYTTAQAQALLLPLFGAGGTLRFYFPHLPRIELQIPPVRPPAELDLTIFRGINLTISASEPAAAAAWAAALRDAGVTI